MAGRARISRIATNPGLANITYVQTSEQNWVYVAAILDLYSRRIVGWAVSRSINTALVLQALGMALCHRERAAGLLLHSDRGVQYASGEYRQALTQAQLVASMSRKGNLLRQRDHGSLLEHAQTGADLSSPISRCRPGSSRAV